MTKRRESKTEPLFKGQTTERKSVKRLRRKDERGGRYIWRELGPRSEERKDCFWFLPLTDEVGLVASEGFVPASWWEGSFFPLMGRAM